MKKSFLYRKHNSSAVRFFVAVLICAWIFSGWPQIFNFPASVPSALAATSAFTATTSDSTFVVPSGTTSIVAKCWGAGGGGGGEGNNSGGGVAGGGGFAQGTIPVNSGESLTVRVGGFGGGGGNNTVVGTDDGGGGGGGGYSAILRGSTFLLQCAGGGGGGAGSAASETGGAGGAGGNTASTTGNNNDAYGDTGSNGANAACGGPVGAGIGEGGRGGTVGAAGLGGAGCAAGGVNGLDGAANAGGAGVDTGSMGAGAAGNNGGAAGGAGTQSDTLPGGGGGGGGVFGGGGGEAGDGEGAGGGGGGAANFDSTATATTTTAGSGATPGNNSDVDYTGTKGVGGAAGLKDASGNNGDDGYVVIIYEDPNFIQAAYRWFPNLNSTRVGDSPSMQDTPTIAPTQGSPIRLRLLLHLAGGGTVAQSATTSLLQFGPKNGGACSSATYTSIAANSGDIRFHENNLPISGAALTPHRLDPIHASSTAIQGIDTVNNQNYAEIQNDFTNTKSAINGGEDALWDFALVDFSAPPSTTYCFRTVQGGGEVLTDYSVYPEITTAGRVKVVLRSAVRLRLVRLR